MIHGQRLQFRWAETISRQEWILYRTAIVAMRDSGVSFLLGGGFALAAFTGRWRDTKDIDFYIHPRDRDRVRAALEKAGFVDYYDRLPYDRKWIYRSVQSDVIVDIIWSMANQRARVDKRWFERAGRVRIRGEELMVLPREEFMWCKLYILQRDHCDWTDLFNLLYASGPEIDWDHLIERLEDDTPLLKALLTVYAWLCPKESRKLPESLWARLGLRPPQGPPPAPGRIRSRFLDTRDWFAGRRPKGVKLEI